MNYFARIFVYLLKIVCFDQKEKCNRVFPSIFNFNLLKLNWIQNNSEVVQIISIFIQTNSLYKAEGNVKYFKLINLINSKIFGPSILRLNLNDNMNLFEGLDMKKT